MNSLETLQLRAGVAKIDITPPVGLNIQGWLGDERSTGVFEKLYAKALVFDNGREKSVLITSDLLAVSPKLTAGVRQAICRRISGIKPSGIMISACHTHCGPVILPGVVGPSRGDPNYLRDLKNNMIKVVIQAAENLEPVKLGFGRGFAFFNVNRRLKTAEGVLMLPNPAGTCDHEVCVIRIDDLQNRPKAVLMNFTCHPTTWGDLLTSPDYPGFAQKFVEEKYQNKVIALFTNGATGDVRPCTVKGKNPKTFGGGTPEWVVKLGTRLGREVVKIARQIKTQETFTLKSGSMPVKFPLEKPMPTPRLEEIIKETKARIKHYRNEKNASAFIAYEEIGLRWAQNTLKSIRNKTFVPWVAGEIQLLRVGDILLAGLSGEIFSGIGLAIKRNMKPEISFIVGYANGCVGYVPTAAALAEGGYETDRSIMSFNVPARFASRTEKVILDTVNKLHKIV